MSNVERHEAKAVLIVKIIVCPLSRVQQIVGEYRPELVVSLLDPDFEFPELGSSYRYRHLCLHFHDAHDCADGQVAPTAVHMNQLLEFVSNWTRSAPIVIHCRAGIGRSSAAGFIAACVHNPGLSELDIARALRRVSAMARPNELLVQLADSAMARKGRMIEAIRETGRHLTWEGVSHENIPFELTVNDAA